MAHYPPFANYRAQQEASYKPLQQTTQRRTVTGLPNQALSVAEEDRELVTDELAGATGEDGRSAGPALRDARCYWLLLAEGHLSRRLFRSMLRMIAAFRLAGIAQETRVAGANFLVPRQPHRIATLFPGAPSREPAKPLYGCFLTSTVPSCNSCSVGFRGVLPENARR